MKVWRRDVKGYIAGLMEQIEAIPSLAVVHAYVELVLSQLLISNLRSLTKCELGRQTLSVRNVHLRV